MIYTVTTTTAPGIAGTTKIPHKSMKSAIEFARASKVKCEVGATEDEPLTVGARMDMDRFNGNVETRPASPHQYLIRGVSF